MGPRNDLGQILDTDVERSGKLGVFASYARTGESMIGIAGTSSAALLRSTDGALTLRLVRGYYSSTGAVTLALESLVCTRT
jgi:hypothetical protein